MKKMLLLSVILSSNLYALDCNRFFAQKIKEHNPTTAISFNKGVSKLDNDEVAVGFDKAFKKNFDFTAKPLESSLKWEGPALPAQFRAGMIEFDQWFTKPMIEYEKSNYDRDAMEVFSRIVWAIGAEQGVRYLLNSKGPKEIFNQAVFKFRNLPRSKENLIEVAQLLHSYSKALKPLQNAPSGMEGMIGSWTNKADFESFKIDVDPADLMTTKNWDDRGRPFETKELVKNLKAEMEKIYSISSKPGTEEFTWYVTNKNFASFNADGTPLMEGVKGNELDHLIYKHLEVGMQQGMRNFIDPIGGKGLINIEQGIQRIEYRMQIDGENLRLDRLEEEIDEAIYTILDVLKRD